MGSVVLGPEESLEHVPFAHRELCLSEASPCSHKLPAGNESLLQSRALGADPRPPSASQGSPLATWTTLSGAGLVSGHHKLLKLQCLILGPNIELVDSVTFTKIKKERQFSLTGDLGLKFPKRS